MIEQIDQVNFPHFIASRERVMLVLGAAWDGGSQNLRRLLPEVSAFYEKQIAFGDVELESHENGKVFQELGILNVPAIASFNHGVLTGLVYGKDCDLTAEIAKLLSDDGKQN